MTDVQPQTTCGRVVRRVSWVTVGGLATAFVALLAYGLLTRAPDTTIDDGLARSEPVVAPGFSLELLSTGRPPPALAAQLGRAAADGVLDLKELRGLPVVLNFWASWCPPCRDEAPLLQQAWARDGPAGVLFLGLNMQDVPGDAREFIAASRQTFPTVRDPTNATARAWGATGLPETFFIRRDGRVVAHVVGVVTREQLARGIRAARQGRATGPARGGEQRPTR